MTFVFPARKNVARFLARLGLEVADRLYKFDRPVGGVEGLLNWDMGLRIYHPDFQDVFLPADVIDPVDFEIVANLSYQFSDLGGHGNVPRVVNLDIALNTDVLQEGVRIE